MTTCDICGNEFKNNSGLSGHKQLAHRRQLIDMENMAWLVESRGSVHKELLQLLSYIDTAEKVESAAAVDEWRDVLALLTGVGFSLWRAAFLTDSKRVTRSWKTILEDAQRLLHILVQDNAINFSQERVTRDWGIGYHLNNARFRLCRARGILEDLLEPGEINAIFGSLDSLADMSAVDARVLTEEWDAIFKTFKAIRQKMGVWVTAVVCS